MRYSIYEHQDASEKEKVVMSVEQRLRAIQRSDKGEILRIVSACRGVEPDNVGVWRRNSPNLQRKNDSNESFMPVMDFLSHPYYPTF